MYSHFPFILLYWKKKQKVLPLKKQWSRTEYAFVMSFIFMLVCVAVAFFYGFLAGTDKAEAKYKTLLADKDKVRSEAGAYDQSSLASYYHLAYLPYEDFRTAWFDGLAALDNAATSKETGAILAELRKQADSSYERAAEGSMPANSPLLQDAQKDLLKSLKLFSQELADYEGSTALQSGTKLAAVLDKDAGLTEAKRFALTAQEEYYSAILEWNKTQVPGLKHSDLLSEKVLSLKDWNSLSLNQKNQYLAKLLADEPLFSNYAPQDLAAQIDMLVADGHSSKMKLNSVQDAVEILSATGAVRPEDFTRIKAKRYSKEILPLIPFFS